MTVFILFKNIFALNSLIIAEVLFLHTGDATLLKINSLFLLCC
jgi:hypothetical protein